jgi:hypothetical protein
MRWNLTSPQYKVLYPDIYLLFQDFGLEVVRFDISISHDFLSAQKKLSLNPLSVTEFGIDLICRDILDEDQLALFVKLMHELRFNINDFCRDRVSGSYDVSYQLGGKILNSCPHNYITEDDELICELCNERKENSYSTSF